MYAGAADAASRYGGKPIQLHSGSLGRARLPPVGLGSQAAIKLVRWANALQTRYCIASHGCTGVAPSGRLH